MRQWKLAELARLAGVSPQQVRNYVDMGVLPPAERRTNGYRAFTARHADALLATRSLAAGHGWSRTRTIMRSVHLGDIGAALAAIDESHADLARERRHVARAAEAFASVAADPAPDVRRAARVGEVARAVGVRTPVLRLWEKRGLLRPRRDAATGYRVFDATEQRTAHLVAVLRRGNHPFTIVEPVIGILRSTGDTGRALAELARRDDDLHRASVACLRGSAALLRYLDEHPPPTDAVSR